MGQLIFGKPTVIQGRKFDDIKLQSSKEGVSRPIIFGTARPVIGNVIASAKPRIVEVRQKQGGKGGPKTTTVSEEIYRTYAIRICEGPVDGVTRIWQNGEIVYDRDSTDDNQIENNQEFLKVGEIFLGRYDQQPSSVLQGAFGINEVSAYRGTCYLVIDDQNLTDNGGVIPQYQFEVQRCVGSYLTSKPYTIHYQESVNGAFSISRISLQSLFRIYQNYEPESVDGAFSVSRISLREVLKRYENYEPESVDGAFSVSRINLKPTLRRYENYEPEGVDGTFSISRISLKKVLIRYENYEPESVDGAFSVSRISLTTP